MPHHAHATMTRALAAAAGLLAFTAAASADFTEVTFENDPAGPAPNGFISADSPLISFSNSDLGPMFIGDFGSQSVGQALAVGEDDASFLLMEFSTLVDFLSLDFGNDDPAFTDDGDSAVLTTYLNGLQVDQVEVVMNRDDIMNQTISTGGSLFNSATLEFYVSSDGLTEIVDNIKFNVIPAPPAAAAAVLGLLLTRSRRRRGG
jgi:hypothetical protein